MRGALRKVAIVAVLALAVPARASESLILYFNESNERVAVALAKLRAAIESQVATRHRVAIEHVPVDYARVEDLRKALRDADARGSALIVAASAFIAQIAREEGVRTPVIFASGQDPLRLGLAKSLRRPGGTMTGLLIYRDVEGKRLELLRELAPTARRVGVLIDEWWDRSSEDQNPEAGVFGALARGFGFEPVYFRANSLAALEALQRNAAARGVDAWYVPATRLAFDEPDAVATVVGAFRKPTVHALSILAQKGGLLSYQAVLESPFDAWAKMAALILDGFPPGEIPLERPQRYELSINTRAVATQGIPVPKSIVLRATHFY